jgi:hypothetical protein
MSLAPGAQIGRLLLLGLIMLMSLIACSHAYRFRYHYVMVEPPGGSEGLEDRRVRIRLDPVVDRGLLHLTLTNKSLQPMTILWEQTHFIDPVGRRHDASETGAAWFFRASEWVTEGARIPPGSTFQARVHAGSQQSYNPFTITRQSGGAVQLSTTPASLFPTTAETASAGQAYQGQQFRFVLALRVGDDITRYPFTFRITEVEVQPPRRSS